MLVLSMLRLEQKGLQFEISLATQDCLKNQKRSKPLTNKNPTELAHLPSLKTLEREGHHCPTDGKNTLKTQQYSKKQATLLWRIRCHVTQAGLEFIM